MIQTLLGHIFNLVFQGQPRVRGVAMHLPNQGGYVGLIMAGATILGTKMQANAAANASQDQIGANTNALNTQIGQYNQMEQMLSPYREAGYNALNALLSMDRLPQDKTPYTPFKPLALTQSPSAAAKAAGGRGAADKLLDPGNLLGNNAADTLADPGGLFGGLAKGGMAQGGRFGGAYIVGEPDPITGEARPEILHMAPGSIGYVQPNPRTPGARLPHRMLGGPVQGEPSEPTIPGGLVHGLGLNALNGGAHGTPGAASGSGQNGVPLPHEGGTSVPAPATKAPAAAAPKPYNFRTDPGYKFAYNEGLRALDDNNAANGLLHSTAETRMATRYGQGMADQEYNDIYNRILAISGLGSGANSSGLQYSLGAGNGIANTFGNIGNAGASGEINTGNAYANGLNSLGGLYALYANRPPQTPPPAYSSGKATVVP